MSGAPRILHITSSLDGGGAERVLLTVLEGLKEFQQTLALGGSGSLVPFVPARVRVERAVTARELVALMLRVQPDVIQTWFDESLLIAMPVAAQLGIPLVHRLYNVPSLQDQFYSISADRHAMVGRALRATTQIVSLSNAASADAAAFYGIAPPPVIHNGFPLAGRRGVAPVPEKPQDAAVILSVGRLASEKGHTHLIEAVRQLADRHPRVELWLAGVGPIEGALRWQAKQAGLESRVRFLGFQEDVTALHAAADVFVFPSLTEGFGNALAEALVAGLPVIVSDLPVVRTDLCPDGRGAMVVPPANPSALSEAVHALLSDPARRRMLAIEARQIGERFAVAHMLNSYAHLYRRVASEVAHAA